MATLAFGAVLDNCGGKTCDGPGLAFVSLGLGEDLFGLFHYAEGDKLKTQDLAPL
jgi:hypothetical protein